MQTAIYGLGGTPFRAMFWLGVFAGVCLQYWIPDIGAFIATLFKAFIFFLAGLVR